MDDNNVPSPLVLVRCIGWWCGNRPLRRPPDSRDLLCRRCGRSFEMLRRAGLNDPQINAALDAKAEAWLRRQLDGLGKDL